MAAYCCFRQTDTGELSDFPRNGNLDTPPPPPLETLWLPEWAGPVGWLQRGGVE